MKTDAVLLSACKSWIVNESAVFTDFPTHSKHDSQSTCTDGNPESRNNSLDLGLEMYFAI